MSIALRNGWLAYAIGLFATGHWIAGIVALIMAAVQLS
jgi:hypothetical protein